MGNGVTLKPGPQRTALPTSIFGAVAIHHRQSLAHGKRGSTGRARKRTATRATAPTTAKSARLPACAHGPNA